MPLSHWGRQGVLTVHARIHFASHWLTIQPSLFDFLEDEVGELDDNQRLFVRIAESVELGRIARKYGWCGN